MLHVFPVRGTGASTEGQLRYDVTVLEPDGKRPHSSVISMVQAQSGYLWLGTLNGLFRFDGQRFQVFNQLNTPGLNDNQIVHLFEDTRNNLWIGTKIDGVVVAEKGVLHAIDFGPGSHDEKLSAACEDELGAVWLYTSEGRLLRHYQGRNIVWQVGAGSKSFCRALAVEKGGMLWLGTDTKLYAIDPRADFSGDKLPVMQVIAEPGGLNFLMAGGKDGLWVIGGGLVQKWRLGKPLDKPGIVPWNKPVCSACEDADGHLVVGTLGDGIYWFDSGDVVHHLNSESAHLSHDYILSLVVDREGSLWAGTDGGGLDHVKRQPFSVLEGTGGFVVQSACEDAGGGLWLNSKFGVRRYENGVLSNYPCLVNGFTNLNGQCIFVDAASNVWAGCAGSRQGQNLFQLRSNRFESIPEFARLNNEDVSVIFQDHSGNLWVGSSGGLNLWNGSQWRKYREADGLSSDNVQAIAEDAEGRLWIGTAGGLNCAKDGVFKVLHGSDGLPGENVTSLLVDSDNILWVGTLGKGLGRMQNGRWTHYTTREGLPSGSLGYLLEDTNGGLWMGSLSGLIRAQKDELNRFAYNSTNQISWRIYDESSGLASGECTPGLQPGACRTRDGRLWFPTTRGLAWVDPSEIHHNTNAPPVVIESVTVADELQQSNPLLNDLPAVVVMPPGREKLDINFTSLNLSSASKTRFKFRMEGYAAGWSPVSETRSAYYSKLPPGHYVFHVIACNEDEIWNEKGATLAIFVQPPFWRTWWFMTVAGLALAGMVIGVVHFLYTQRMEKQLEGLHRQQALEHERSRIARDIHDQLGASMTQISLLAEMVESDKNDPAEVEGHARQITQTARDTSRVLDEIVWTVNPSNDTLEGLVNYLCKYAQEYFAVADIRFRLDIPPQLPAASITPEVRHNVFLAAKEAITNVVKHAKATEVWLRLKIEPRQFIIEVQDNGTGPLNLAGKKTRNGLRNMAKRMEDAGGDFSLKPAPEGGAVARLTVPINK